ncbi:MAG: lamin tail domain-containing protein [Planctomycetes bacterium]|nr:lamin tail domain-containing protein [Planctomycetota bacterium]
MTVSRLSVAALAITLLVIGGCNTGSRKGPRTSFGPQPGPGGGTLNVTRVANPNTALLGTVINALVLRIENTSTTSVASLGSLTVTASGTVDESTVLTTATLRHDLNLNGQVDQNDPQLANVPAPAFAAANGSVTFNLNPPLQIPILDAVQVIVTVETVASTGAPAQTAFVGQTVILGVNGAGDVGLAYGNATAPATATFPLTGDAVTLGIGTHLLISEVNYITVGEFIEIFNPTPETIALDDYYLSDFTQDVAAGVTRTQFYYLLPTGQNFGPNANDFVVRFPAGATIAPGEFQVIAVDMNPNNGFSNFFPNVTPTYGLRNVVAPAQQMRIFQLGAWVAGNVPGNGELLTNNGEVLFLFTWNAQAQPPTSLITDVDMVAWGNTGDGTPTGNQGNVEKSGVTVNGETYAQETPLATQDARRLRPAVGGGSGLSMQRQNYIEAGEVQNGTANGTNGQDETSEDWNANFNHATPTPGGP